MQKMGVYRIASGEHYLVTTNGPSSYYILLFHYVRFNYNYFTQKESEVSAAGVKGIFAKALDDWR